LTDLDVKAAIKELLGRIEKIAKYREWNWKSQDEFGEFRKQASITHRGIELLLDIGRGERLDPYRDRAKYEYQARGSIRRQGKIVVEFTLLGDSWTLTDAHNEPLDYLDDQILKLLDAEFSPSP
jgi:hypothetical protein